MKGDDYKDFLNIKSERKFDDELYGQDGNHISDIIRYCNHGRSCSRDDCPTPRVSGTKHFVT